MAPRSAAAAAVFALFVATWPGRAAAYRPFDGTDADVARLHTVEVELGPAGYYRLGSERSFVAGGILNYGLAPDVELVLEGFDFIQGGAAAPERNRLTDTGLFLKRVWKRGCLQGEAAGPSFATETGALLPTVHDAKGFGAYAGGILSTCLGDALVVHWNTQLQILRASYDFDLFTGAIVEPLSPGLAVRPVAEVFWEDDFAAGARTYSGLVGAIWRATEKLSVDAAVREASVAGRAVTEVRTGFSVEIP